MQPAYKDHPDNKYHFILVHSLSKLTSDLIEVCFTNYREVKDTTGVFVRILQELHCEPDEKNVKRQVIMQLGELSKGMKSTVEPGLDIIMNDLPSV